MRKFADTMEQTDRQTDGSKTETTLSSVDTRGSWPIRKFDDTQRTDNQTVQRLRPLYPLWILEGVGQ